MEGLLSCPICHTTLWLIPSWSLILLLHTPLPWTRLAMRIGRTACLVPGTGGDARMLLMNMSCSCISLLLAYLRDSHILPSLPIASHCPHFTLPFECVQSLSQESVISWEVTLCCAIAPSPYCAFQFMVKQFSLTFVLPVLTVYDFNDRRLARL